MVYYDKVRPSNGFLIGISLTYSLGNPGECFTFWHDDRLVVARGRPFHISTIIRHFTTQLGNIDLLLRHARRSLSNDFYSTEIQRPSCPWAGGSCVGCSLCCNCWRDIVAGTVCAAILSWFVAPTSIE